LVKFNKYWCYHVVTHVCINFLFSQDYPEDAAFHYWLFVAFNSHDLTPYHCIDKKPSFQASFAIYPDMAKHLRRKCI